MFYFEKYGSLKDHNGIILTPSVTRVDILCKLTLKTPWISFDVRLVFILCFYVIFTKKIFDNSDFYFLYIK